MRATDLIGKSLSVEGHMITHTGILFNLLDPNPDDINPLDIAVHLSRTARWNGGTFASYTVAEHCCRCHDRAPEHLKALALLHDAEEAYWGDIIKTVKSILKNEGSVIPGKMKELRQVILKKFGVSEEGYDEVLKIDLEELQWDFDNLIVSSQHQPIGEAKALTGWLRRFRALEEAGQIKRQ